MSSTLFHTPKVQPPPVVGVATTQPVEPQYTHAIEPELLGVCPRSAHWTGETVAVRRLLWNLMIGTALVLFFFARNDLATWDALIEKGVPVTATVYDKFETHGKTTSYNTRYSFYGDGIQCYGSDSVSHEAYESAQIGDTLTVTYLPGSNGEKWQQGLATSTQREDRLSEWILASLFCVGALAAGLTAYEIEVRGQMRLLKKGVATVGRVFAGNITTHKSNKTYWIQYEYQAFQNKRYKNVVAVPQSSYEHYTLRNPYLTVVYDPAEVSSSKPYFKLTAAQLLGK